MGLLNEYAITPDVFSKEVNCENSKHNFIRLKEILLDSGIVRDLQDGRWFQQFSGSNCDWNTDRVKFLANLKKQNRLRTFSSISQDIPNNDFEWCREALGAHNLDHLKGVISTEQTCRNVKKPKIVAAIEKMHCCTWISSTNCSLQLDTKAQNYIDALRLIVQCSNSIMFIDPYLNPQNTQYGVFTQLFEEIGKRSKKPVIEIHTTAKVEACVADQPTSGNLEKNFRDEWTTVAQQNGLVIEVYKWQSFHDRFLITDLIGLSLPFGFQTTNNQSDKTIWTRLTRQDRDAVQSHFSVTNKPRPITIK